MAEDPWLSIPAAEYEAHMRAIGQDQALREIFQRVWMDARPARVAVLGCGAGADLGALDSTLTTLAVGVDVNPRFLDLARERASGLGARLHLVAGDVLTVDIPPGPYDLIHAALLLEYVEPALLLSRAHAWLAPAGALSLVVQEPADGLPAVSDTPYPSLRALADVITLRKADQVVELATSAGFALVMRRTIRLPAGKRLVSLVFDKVRQSIERPRRSARC